MVAAAGIWGASVVLCRMLILLALVEAFARLLCRPLRAAPGESASVPVLGRAGTATGICCLSSAAR